LVAQITAGYLLALFLAKARESLAEAELARLGQELLTMPAKVSQVLERLDGAARLGQDMADAKSVCFWGVTSVFRWLWRVRLS
jgi:glucosamine--fructose-6-phosphate aminotransferase (isomerizing)